jgi:hypothetical protein
MRNKFLRLSFIVVANQYYMAKIPDGILGKFLGKAGPVTGYMRNGENLLRTSSRRKDNLITPKRTAQQQKIKVCNEFTKAFSGTGFFNKTFPAYGDSGTGYNRATSVIMNLAITGSYPNIAIAYPLVLISKGPLPAAEYAAAEVTNDGNIFFNWTDNTGTGTAKADDLVILLAYFPGLNQIIYSFSWATRADCQALLDTSILKGQVAETWLGLLSKDEKVSANSVFTGIMEL